MRVAGLFVHLLDLVLSLFPGCRKGDKGRRKERGGGGWHVTYLLGMSWREVWDWVGNIFCRLVGLCLSFVERSVADGCKWSE